MASYYVAFNGRMQLKLMLLLPDFSIRKKKKKKDLRLINLHNRIFWGGSCITGIIIFMIKLVYMENCFLAMKLTTRNQIWKQFLLVESNKEKGIAVDWICILFFIIWVLRKSLF